MHGTATFYSKLTVSCIKPTLRNDEMGVLLPYSEFKKFHSFHPAEGFRSCLLWLHTRSNFTAYVQNVFR